MILYRVFLYEDATPFIDTAENIAKNISEWLSDQEEEDTISIEKLEMSQEDFEKLPEWQGP